MTKQSSDGFSTNTLYILLKFFFVFFNYERHLSIAFPPFLCKHFVVTFNEFTIFQHQSYGLSRFVCCICNECEMINRKAAGLSMSKCSMWTIFKMGNMLGHIHKENIHHKVILSINCYSNRLICGELSGT